MEFDTNNTPWSDRYREAGLLWSDREAAAAMLEDCKSAIMAQWQTELGEMPINRAEQTVKASARWKSYITDAVEARRLANIAKVELEYIRMKAHEWQSLEANKRAEMRL